MTIRALLVPAVLACAFLTPTILSAQHCCETFGSERSATGLIVGLNFTGASVTLDDPLFASADRELGGGMYFTLGYNFTPEIGLMLHAGGVVLSDDEDRTLGHADLGLRFSLANPARAVVPYLEIAFGGGSLQDEIEEESFELSGVGFTGAVGVNYFLSRRLALNVDFRYNLSEFNTLKIGSESVSDTVGMGINSSRVNFGFNWYPMAAR